MKNFSLLETAGGDYALSPAYDLLNTHLHMDDSAFALEKGLFSDGFKSETREKTGHPGKADFEELGRRIGVVESRLEKLMRPFLSVQPGVEELVGRSFLDDISKKGYLLQFRTRRNHLNA